MYSTCTYAHMVIIIIHGTVQVVDYQKYIIIDDHIETCKVYHNFLTVV